LRRIDRHRLALNHPHDEPPNANARGDAGTAQAGRLGDQDARRLARLALDPLARGRASYFLVRRQQQHNRPVGPHLLVRRRIECTAWNARKLPAFTSLMPGPRAFSPFT
jgi:hypothetical protein